jgi:phage shock protein A
MKKTIKQLEDQIAYLKTQAFIAEQEMVKLKAVNDAYKIISQYIPATTIALERITDAVAHVLADLSRHWEVKR